VIISGNNETRIYEYQVGIEEGKESLNLLNTIEVHPNPFANVTDIRFNPQFAGEITVNVYDVSGRLTKNIYTGSTDGYSTLTWYGDDNNGRIVPRGVYFLRVDNPDTGDIIGQKILKVK
jgi:flagellar hook assembly protein FlgD